MAGDVSACPKLPRPKSKHADSNEPPVLISRQLHEARPGTGTDSKSAHAPSFWPSVPWS